VRQSRRGDAVTGLEQLVQVPGGEDDLGAEAVGVVGLDDLRVGRAEGHDERVAALARELARRHRQVGTHHGVQLQDMIGSAWKGVRSDTGNLPVGLFVHGISRTACVEVASKKWRSRRDSNARMVF
jgi:hypothetical protein